MNQDVIDLWDRFTHGQMSRRDFFDRLTRIAGSAAAATAMLPLLQNNYALAQTIAPDDPRLLIERLSYPAPEGGAIAGYVARPKNAPGKSPVVIVIHENRGLNPHIEDITRRVALEGFFAFGIDLLSPSGGTPKDEDAARDAIGRLDRAATIARLAAAVPFLATHPTSTGSVGAIGFCWGGGMVNALAVASPELKAGVAYYGQQPPAADVPKIRAALLLQYAGLDERINAGIPAYEAALKAAHKTYEVHIYPNVQHAFNNDTGGARFNKPAADLAWGRTIAFLKKHLI